MIRDITIGQYYPANSVIHRLDPRVKLMGAVVFIISAFAIDNVFSFLMATLFLFTIIRVSTVPIKFILKGLKAIFFLLLFTVALNIFMTPGTEIFRWWIFHPTWEGLEAAFMRGIRLVYMIMGSSLMTLTTTPNHLTDGLEKALKPLNKIHVPIHEITMMMFIALRFIPILLEETDKIMKAQQARCADFESGNLIRRAKSLVPILIPLFISAFRRANDLAMAMDARCYHGGEGRTKMKPLRYTSADYKGYILLALYLLSVIAVNVAYPHVLPHLMTLLGR